MQSLCALTNHYSLTIIIIICQSSHTIIKHSFILLNLSFFVSSCLGCKWLPESRIWRNIWVWSSMGRIFFKVQLCSTFLIHTILYSHYNSLLKFGHINRNDDGLINGFLGIFVISYMYIVLINQLATLNHTNHRV